MNNYDAIITEAVDYYIERVNNMPPECNFPPTHRVCLGNYKKDDMVTVAVSEVIYNGKLSHIQFYCTTRPVSGKVFGKVPYHVFLTLEEQMEEGLNEYRRKRFSRISNRRRHAVSEAR